MSRLRRWTKRLGVVLLELLVVLTIASVAYNAVTAEGVKPATALYTRRTVQAVLRKSAGTQRAPTIVKPFRDFQAVGSQH